MITDVNERSGIKINERCARGKLLTVNIHGKYAAKYRYRRSLERWNNKITRLDKTRGCVYPLVANEQAIYLVWILKWLNKWTDLGLSRVYFRRKSQAN